MTRAALVTGATGGLGLVIADSLAAAGYRIALNGIEPQGYGDDRARELERKHGGSVAYFPADLSQRDRIETMMTDIEHRFGGVDILVNNAVVRHFSPIDSFDPDHWDKAIKVNLSAAFHLARLSIPSMKRKGWGRIINVSSYYGHRGAQDRIDYVTTKTALIGMARAIAIECARMGITANAICPGSVGTEAILERIRGMARDSGRDFEELARDYATLRNPMGRFVATESIGAMIVFLCSDAACDISGTALPIDGGWLAA